MAYATHDFKIIIDNVYIKYVHKNNKNGKPVTS